MEAKNDQALAPSPELMKIALLGHSHHKLTHSVDFFFRLLRRLGTVETYFDESWSGQKADWVDAFDSRNFDCIAIFQAHECFDYIQPNHPNIVFVPMYDAMIWKGEFYWRQVFNSAKVLCFSSALHREVAVRNPASVYFQYYPDPQKYPVVQDYSAPRGYYWRRRKEISSHVIRTLAKGTVFARFTLHDVPDPGGNAESSITAPAETDDYRITGWHASGELHINDLLTHNIYFAPRLHEGIGFGFLKAMAMGMCVVAPDTATHNEYIAQGCTGILYHPGLPEAVDLRTYHQIGLRARESVERGRARWEARLDEVLTFVSTPTGALATGQFAVDSWIEAESLSSPQSVNRNSRPFPSVAVVTVCLNAGEEIEKTIRSVTEQNYPTVEYAIFDGGSTDGTIDVIRKYEGVLATWASQPDKGVYSAMQQSLASLKSDWVLFMNAGDFFVSRDALQRLFARLPDSAEVVYGHHIFRHTNGSDELRLAADFRWMWSRLQEGRFDVAYPAGFPAHQATAVLTRLLRKLEFDPLFRIAADHDLLWRAWRRGAEFFHSDEIVSVYLAGGFSAKQMRRCKQEWSVIALRYGKRKGALRFQNLTDAEAEEAIELDYGHRSGRLAARLRDTILGRMPGFSTLARTLNNAYVAAAKKIYLPSRGEKGLTGTLSFTRAGIPTFLAEARGLSEPEEWGTWSDGNVVELIFRQSLPDSFTLVLHASAFGRNANAAVSVRVGAITRQLTTKGPRRRKYTLDFSDNGGDKTMVISIPYPTAPAELLASKSSDRRRIGLGFVSMRIQPGKSIRKSEPA